ncbi:hypothetical protein Z517_08811 [Fonsecaea pedrosoi CBS 271.37]|uniref:Unplaced genomic scaffold supercont1.5, whole genome shotgun sequence n=1 Tax=Fonsecaea pedrosoi CBS 271.37 TaxID=1442368 RepID=A0A0D2DMS1_9EURO|nr:uncharacterized protein Z517_08811 [Fonsecaea pedrosoi CBS 271.37]KIW78971.1 hypothetical protein Z517_08811 [Fonsecaea pedrosoi CBS 271.37]
MAPTISNLFPRQGFGGNGGPGDFGDDRGPGKGSGIPIAAIIGIVITVIIVGLIVGFFIFRHLRLRRNRAANGSINLRSATSNNPTTGTPATDPLKYGASSGGGYTATADQNQSLLGNAEAPAIVMWDPNASDHGGIGSTQDGFGYDNNLNLQRPASVASFSAPPPRYEEATNSTGGLPAQAQGEAASYYNPAVSMVQERGASLTSQSEAQGSRTRALSVDQRSVNGDRSRSISRFREEGMVDVSVNVETKS